MIYQFRNGIKISKLFLISCLFFVFYFIVKDVNIYGFNLVDRVLSSFDSRADLSTIERYGSTEAILNLAKDKANIVGVGIYNYGYYAMDYLPDYMSGIKYSKDKPLPSFNFVLQLIAEFGFILFLFFIIKSYLLIRFVKNYFVKIFFLFLMLYAMTFQVLNFAVPFLILLISTNEENRLYNR